MEVEDQRKSDGSSPSINSTGGFTPRGVHAIYQSCNMVYPDQANPLQVTTMVKYWLGGPDPLDYISMFANKGDPGRGIPSHWHYVSFGLSDLHGDGRVHDNSSGSEGASGFGFELTFRLRREPGEGRPPTWPASLMQSFAKYVFQSENCVQSGDHISWHRSLDGSDSRLQHMLVTEDPQLSPTQTPFGTVSFLQIVGVCVEELKAAQHWNGPGVLELLRSTSQAGGPWLITDMRRGETAFEIDPQLQDKLDRGMEQEGSNLSGVSGYVRWEELREGSGDGGSRPSAAHGVKRSEDSGGSDGQAAAGSSHGPDRASGREKARISDRDSEEIKSMLQRGLNRSSVGREGGADPCDSTTGDCPAGDYPQELLKVVACERGVHLTFNAETGSLLLLALRGRLRHGRHFTFMGAQTQSAVTLVSPAVVGTMVNASSPYASHGGWLQVLLTDQFLDQLSDELDCLSDIKEMDLPKHFSWPEKKLSLSVIPDDSVL